MSIQETVASRGWQYFREREAYLLSELSGSSEKVIATGGGVVIRPENIAVMRRSGKVVWLDASPANIALRMLADNGSAGQRPPLRGKDSVVEIDEVLQERMPLYEEAMHCRVVTDDVSPEEVARRILAWLETELQAGS